LVIKEKAWPSKERASLTLCARPQCLKCDGTISTIVAPTIDLETSVIWPLVALHLGFFFPLIFGSNLVDLEAYILMCSTLQISLNEVSEVLHIFQPHLSELLSRLAYLA